MFKFSKKLFPGQQDDERICMVVREHWMVFFMRFLSWVIFALILILINWAANSFIPAQNNAAFFQYLNLFESVYMMFLILGLLIIWTIYYLNVQIITNERVVDITQNSLLSHTVSELHLSRIEDVTAETTGVFGTFLDYGNVYIQTAGETERFTFSRVPNPALIEKLVLDLYEKIPDEAKHKDALEK